jgi:glycogen operon protein
MSRTEHLTAAPVRRWLAAVLASLLAACAPEDVPQAPQPPAQEAVGTAEQGSALTWTLGARYDATRTNITFQVFSSRATRIDVYIYSQPQNAQERLVRTLTRDATTNVWSVTVPVSALGFTGPVYYGYRAWGPNWPFNTSWTKGSAAGFIADVDAQGNRFNPNKLLLDPYALEVSHDPLNSFTRDGSVYGSGTNGTTVLRTLDSGIHAPKGIVLTEDTATFGVKPTRSLKDEIIYEVHVRGLTMSDPSITTCRGTYQAAGQKAAALRALGITAIEFLPVHEAENDQNDNTVNSTAGDNYWGYMTVNYFAPDRLYSCDKSPGGPTREFKAMVKAFHDQGIKVYVDVVYNHTAEGGPWFAGNRNVMNLWSWRGLDNPTYYSLTSDFQFPWDNTGTGNNYNTFNPVAQDLIVHSLRYWRDVLGVDGYRFDLASVLGNTCQHGCFNYDKLNAGTALNRIWRDLTPRPPAGGTGVDLIAEPWAIGGNSYQVGNFPSGWAEWNGIYRDDLRRDQNQLGVATITPSQLASRFAGSSDLYGDDGRRPQNSINFMVAHDGFTLKDLYSCNSKNNLQAWPFGPSDGGSDDNKSWDQGNIAADQRKASRNGFAFMMLSAGVPMFNGGDEYLRDIRCNNNPYNLDSSANWLSWTFTTDQQDFRTFSQRLMAFRNSHPSLRPLNFYSTADNDGDGLPQHSWFMANGQTPTSTFWSNGNEHAIAWRIDGTELGDTTQAIYVAYNGWSGSVNFTLPAAGGTRQWYRVTDTCNWAEGLNQVATPGTETLIGGQGTVYGLCGRSVALFIAR